MPESVIGATTSDIVHQIKTKEGSLTVTHNTKDIVANTLGHLMAIPTTHSILWTWGSAFRNPPKELATELFERYKDVPWKGDVLVRVGKVSILGDIQRMLARNEDVRGRPWNLKDAFGRGVEFAGKLGVALLMSLEGLKAKLFRTDYYNAFANTVTVYHPKLAVGMHELGHAEWFNQMDSKKRAAYNVGLLNQLIYIPFLRPYVEWQASAKAMNRFKNDTERRQGLKILEAAWATYLGFDSLVSIALISPAIALPLIKATAWKVSGDIALGKSVFHVAYGAALHPYGSSIAGHLMNRLYPKKEQRFGYVFEGKKTEKHAAFEKKKAVTIERKAAPTELSAHQVLVATAKAPKPNEPLGVEGKGGRQFSEEPLKQGKRPLHSNTSRITF